MATFRTLALKRGSYCTRDGSWLHATDQRMRRWPKVVQELSAKGIRIPVAWGHQPFAEPLDADANPSDPLVQARREYLNSAMNAGFVTGMEYDPETGNLWVEGEAPGLENDEKGNLVSWVKLPSGHQLKTAVREVSLSFNNWKTGKGEVYRDVPIHLALCVLPRSEGQAGFEKLTPEARAYRKAAQIQAEGGVLCSGAICLSMAWSAPAPRDVYRLATNLTPLAGASDSSAARSPERLLFGV